MKKNKDFGRRILAIITVVVLVMGCFCVNGLEQFGRLISALRKEKSVVDENPNDNTDRKKSDSQVVFDEINNIVPLKYNLIEINGAFLKMLGCRDYYNRDYGFSVTKDGYIISQKNYTSLKYELEQIIMLKRYLDDRGVKLLYVNEPAKYIDDAVYKEEFALKGDLPDIVTNPLGEATEQLSKIEACD